MPHQNKTEQLLTSLTKQVEGLKDQLRNVQQSVSIIRDQQKEQGAIQQVLLKVKNKPNNRKAEAAVKANAKASAKSDKNIITALDRISSHLMRNRTDIYINMTIEQVVDRVDLIDSGVLQLFPSNTTIQAIIALATANQVDVRDVDKLKWFLNIQLHGPLGVTSIPALAVVIQTAFFIDLHRQMNQRTMHRGIN
jgi:hypothetical protein